MGYSVGLSSHPETVERVGWPWPLSSRAVAGWAGWRSLSGGPALRSGRARGRGVDLQALEDQRIQAVSDQVPL